MDIFTFLTKIFEFGAWPTTALIVIFVLQHELKLLLSNITKFKAGSFEVELANIKKEIQVVTAKFDEDEDEGKTDIVKISGNASEKFITSFDEIELKVLKAMVESRFITRSVSGVAKDAKLTKAEVQKTYGKLIAKEMIEQVENAEGNLRWRVTALGRVIASEA